jgi:hypothetical protein
MLGHYLYEIKFEFHVTIDTVTELFHVCTAAFVCVCSYGVMVVVHTRTLSQLQLVQPRL